ncbi:MAG: tRNA (adenosine(37)-N6)-threonylcarbamoyltransferase complex ATPase subunit type 1 TsaE [Gammaproteobacteria bacterium]|nr:tRNA (adenosine(37)-N6)-threonylcarbamoyltransferase complex ATPase subunit type 1 TsaE [SAR86 cluster bacterium]|tara:strand:+ start:1131 stop:1592 length:462 start_codon:yes stop_codon:yes gene_type:complete
MKKEAKSLLDTRKIAQKLATFIKENNNFLIFYLKGNLGSGKTTLVREILKCLGWSSPVKSPTFSIMEEYIIDDIDIYHADLYRLKTLNDFEMIGFEPNFRKRGVLFVEWPEILDSFSQAIEIEINIDIKGQYRIFSFNSADQKFLSCIDGVDI